MKMWSSLRGSMGLIRRPKDSSREQRPAMRRNCEPEPIRRQFCAAAVADAADAFDGRDGGAWGDGDCG